MIYNVQIDENGFVTDLTKISPAPAGYVPMEVGEIPHDVMCGYYQLINGVFVLDEAKKAEYDAANQPSDTFPEL